MSLSILFLLDVLQAFPMLAHRWLWLVLNATIRARALFNKIVAHYHNPSVLDDMHRLKFLILSGVIQGCPLSGSLFAIAMDPILRLLFDRLENPRIGRRLVRACANSTTRATKIWAAEQINAATVAANAGTGASIRQGKVVRLLKDLRRTLQRKEVGTPSTKKTPMRSSVQ